MSYLLDTNVISELTKSEPNKNLLHWLGNVPNEALFISVLSLGEIRKEIEAIQDKNRKEKLRVWLEYDLRKWFANRILSIDAKVAERWGELMGKSKKTLPAVDSLLAASALHHELRLVTRNVTDFHFPGLDVINPWN